MTKRIGSDLRLAKTRKTCYYIYSHSMVVGDDREVYTHKERYNGEVKCDDKRGDAAVPEP